MGVTFETTIRLGDILTLVGGIVVATGGIASVRYALKLFAFRLDIIDATIEDLQKDIKAGTLHEHRITRLEKDSERHTELIHELQRGHGLVREKFPKG